jgi:hypothetical protein
VMLGGGGGHACPAGLLQVAPFVLLG